MILTKKSSAWLFAGLQAAFSIVFIHFLSNVPAPQKLSIADGPSWLTFLAFLEFGISLVLILFALWKFELTAIALLFIIHTVCPIIFFTDLTRNPYFTQIMLLNVWVAFVWVVWLWESFQTRRWTLPRTPANLPLFCFFAVTVVSWAFSFLTHQPEFYSAMFSEGTKASIFLIVNCIAVFFIATTLEEKWRKLFIWTTLTVGAAAAAYGLMQYYGLEKIWQKSVSPFLNRPVSTFGNPNFLSSYLLLLLPLAAVEVLSAVKNRTRILSFAFLGLIVTGIIATMTRSTWVGSLLAFALLPLSPAFRDLMKKNKKILWIVCAMLVLSIFFWPKSKLGGYGSLWQRVSEIKEVKATGHYGPWHQRMLIWVCCWQMVRDHPIIGKGWGLLELFYPYYQGKALFHPLLRGWRTHANNGHNEIFEIWSQTGFIGMGIYVWLWVVLIAFGIKAARDFYPSNPQKSALTWALLVSLLAMLVDNIFGNVSIHFAVPAFLFWWQAGLMFAATRSENQNAHHPAEWFVVPTESHLSKIVLGLSAVGFLWTAQFIFRREFQEIHYFRGFKSSKSSGSLDPAKTDLEKAWKWYPREVNSNYELSNTYARISQQNYIAGLHSQADAWRKKAIWAYKESLDSNNGYDEIYFNLAAIQNQINWLESDFPEFQVESPDGQPTPISGKNMNGAIFNYSRALTINPMSTDAYSYLGNTYFQNLDKYHEPAEILYRQAVYFNPNNKDYLVNLAFLQIRDNKLDDAYNTLKHAILVDPFHELTRRNVRVLLDKLKRPDDVLAQIEGMILQINPLIAAKQWPQLKTLCERLVALVPDSYQLRFILANVCFELRDFTRAEKEYQEAIRIDPNNLGAWTNLSMAYRAENKIPEAMEVYERILQLNPSDAKVSQELQRLKMVK